jgi:membrane protein DedA with SNARE-associated domain
MDHLREWLSGFPMGIYLILLVAPFIQEDAAIVAGASAAMGALGHQALLFLSLLVGLTASDLWKYWIGRLAHTQRWAAGLANNPAILGMRSAVVGRLGVTLLIARFIPGTRIPLYIASGYFRAPFARFAAFVTLSGAIYIGIAFALFHLLGQIAGERIKTWGPLVAIVLVLVLVGASVVRSRRQTAAAKSKAVS